MDQLLMWQPESIRSLPRLSKGQADLAKSCGSNCEASAQPQGCTPQLRPATIKQDPFTSSRVCQARCNPKCGLIVELSKAWEGFETDGDGTARPAQEQIEANYSIAWVVCKYGQTFGEALGTSALRPTPLVRSYSI